MGAVVLPATEALDEEGWRRAQGIIEHALATRPAGVKRVEHREHDHVHRVGAEQVGDRQVVRADADGGHRRPHGSGFVRWSVRGRRFPRAAFPDVGWTFPDTIA